MKRMDLFLLIVCLLLAAGASSQAGSNENTASAATENAVQSLPGGLKMHVLLSPFPIPPWRI